jgi:hypothetical protein
LLRKFNFFELSKYSFFIEKSETRIVIVVSSDVLHKTHAPVACTQAREFLAEPQKIEAL